MTERERDELKDRLRRMDQWLAMAEEVHSQIVREIGERLFELRRSQRVSLQGMADRIGCSHAHVLHLETGKARITPDVIDAYCVALAGHQASPVVVKGQKRKVKA